MTTFQRILKGRRLPVDFQNCSYDDRIHGISYLAVYMRVHEDFEPPRNTAMPSAVIFKTPSQHVTFSCDQAHNCASVESISKSTFTYCIVSPASIHFIIGLSLRACFKTLANAGRARPRWRNKIVRNDFEQPQAGPEGASPRDGRVTRCVHGST